MKRWLVLSVFVCACGGPSMTETDAGFVDAGEMLPDPPEMVELIGAPNVLEDTNPDPGVVEVELTAQNQRVSLGGSMTYEMMTYNGTVPGPLLQAAAGDEVIVHFRNELDEPTTVHWHGLRISDEMDGSPRIQEPVAPGGTFTYRFVVPEAGTFWYHPHVRANEQLEKGLYGPIVIRDEHDPSYDAERMIVLDDILTDPALEVLPPFLASHPEQMHGRFGNVLLTNGQDTEVLEMGSAQGGHVERWRVVNVANARTMELSLWNASFRVIGTDGGLLREPYETETITLPVGARVDLEVVYDQAGPVTFQSQVLVSDGMGGVRNLGVPVYAVAVEGSGTPRTIERTFPEAPASRAPTREEVLAFSVINGASGIEWQLNGQTHPDAPLFVFQEGDVVRMTLDNRAGPEHPFHLHGQWFEVVSGDGVRPGLYDTVLIPGLTQVEIIAYLDNPGRWMAHCHILEHAELGMMGEFVVEAR